MALPGMYPSPDLKKSVKALRVGDPLVLKKQEWGQKISLFVEILEFGDFLQKISSITSPAGINFFRVL